MKQNFIKQLLKMTRYALYGMFIQCLLFSFMLAGNSNAQRSLSDVQVSIDMKKVTLASAFGQLSAQTGFEFVYDHAKINLNKKIDVNVAGSLEKALMTVSKDANVQFKRINDNIFVSKRTSNDEAVSEQYMDEADVTISGKITDSANGEGLPGASVLVKGTSLGTTTNLDGDYKLTVPSSESVLVISFIGYITQEITVGSQTNISVVMQEDATQLSEVVVTGYALQSTETLTTSIAKVDAADIENLPAGGSSVNALVGRVSGVSIIQNSGEPGAAPAIQIRGGTTPGFGGDTPLYIVDGFVQNDPADVDMNDVEEFTILKDAASTAIYGAQAANGVIIIKTKSGKQGKMEVTFKYNHGYESVEAAKQEWLTPEEEIYYGRLGFLRYEGTTGYSRLNRSGWWASPQSIDDVDNASVLFWYDDVIAKHGSLPGGYVTTNDPLTGKLLAWKPTDWEKNTLTPGNSNTFYINLAGGTDKAQYSLSLSSLDDKAVGVFNRYKRYYLNAKANFQLRDNLTSGISFRYTYTDEDDGSGGNWYQRSGRQPTTIRYWNEDGSPAPNNANGGKPNPDFFRQTNQIARYGTDMNASAFIEWEIIEGLKFKPQMGLRHRVNNFGSFQPSNVLSSRRNQSGSLNNDINLQFDGVLTYDKTFNQVHNLGLLAGTSFRNTYDYALSVSAFGGSTDLIPTIISATPNENSDAASFYTKTAIQSWFGQLSYDYDKKYLLNVTVRRDGNYKFTKANQWGLFYGVSGGWNLHNEDFWDGMSISNVVKRAKFKVAYGETGKSSGLSINDTNGAYSTNLYAGKGGIYQSTLKNSDLVWETTKEFVTGIQTAFFDRDKLTFSMEYYDKKSVDRLFGEPLPSFTGFGSITTNVGIFQSKGIEFAIGSQVISTEKFTWQLDAFLDLLTSQKTVKLPQTATEKNRISGFNVTNPDDPTGEPIQVGGFAEGERWGALYTYVSAGVVQNWEEADAYNAQIVDEISASRRNRRDIKVPGDLMYADLNGDGLINSLDRKFVGWATPNKRIGMTNSLKYNLDGIGKFDLSFTVEAQLGHTVRDNDTPRLFGQQQGSDRLSIIVRDSWLEEGDGSQYSTYAWADGHMHNEIIRGDDRWYQSGSYLGFRTVQIGYTIPKDWSKKVGMQSFKVIATGTNLGYLTRYKGYNPQEVDGADVLTTTSPNPLRLNVGVIAKF